MTTLATGCAGPPKALEGEFSALRPEVATESDIGTHVRWGGRLVKVDPERERTCFEILSLPLGNNARPDGDAHPARRFLACRDGFADPAAYPRERLVTITGELIGFTTREIGEYEYHYPIVRARATHLWPRPQPQAAPYPVMRPWGYDPFWGPYPYADPRYRY
ncbi:MAG: Slp family lipoprotein [Halofilum sp. (in: g-proteobacteria)]